MVLEQITETIIKIPALIKTKVLALQLVQNIPETITLILLSILLGWTITTLIQKAKEKIPTITTLTISLLMYLLLTKI